MRWVLLVMLATMVGCAGPSGPGALVDSSGVNCVEHRKPFDDTHACDLASGQTVVFQTGDDRDSYVYAISLDADGGGQGPWVLGDRWLVSMATPDPDLAEQVREALGGEVIHDPDDIN